VVYSRNVGQMQRGRRRIDIVIVLGVGSLESMERRVAVVLSQSRILKCRDISNYENYKKT